MMEKEAGKSDYGNRCGTELQCGGSMLTHLVAIFVRMAFGYHRSLGAARFRTVVHAALRLIVAWL